MHYWVLCAWGLCLFVSFLGYGKLLLSLFQFRDAPWAFSGSVGVALIVTAGGILNWLGLVRTPVLIAVVSVGVLLALALEWHHLGSLGVTLLHNSFAYAPLIIVAAVPVLGNVRADLRTFNALDDFPAYLTIPEATLQTGTLPYDPFNERRITSCLGAPYVLQSMMLLVGDIRSVRFVDVSIGFVLYTGLLIVIFRVMGLPLFPRIALASLSLVVPVDRWNATMVVLPAALFCSQLLILIHPGLGSRLNWRRSALLGVIAAAIVCMKSNYLPAAIGMCSFYYLAWAIYRRSVSPVLQYLVWAVVLLGCMLPWMADMHHKEGTFLFPILGRGYDASAYGVIPLPNGSHEGLSSSSLWVWLTALPMATPLLIGLAGLGLAFRRRAESAWVNPLASMLAGSAIAVSAIASSTGGESIGRYSLPFELPALIILLGFVVVCQRELRHWAWWLAATGAASLVALGVIAFAFGVRHRGYEKYLEDARLADLPSVPWVRAQEEQRVRALQKAVPPGERVLARILFTYPFDFKRNQIFVADYSGMASLPPGIPIEGTASELRSYLLAHHIRYVAFDPKRTMFPDEASGASVVSILKGESKYGRHGWLVLQTKVANTVQEKFAELGRECRHIYDDGQVYVLDLSA